MWNRSESSCPVDGKSPLFKTWFVTIYISLNADIYVHMALKTTVSNISHSHQKLPILCESPYQIVIKSLNSLNLGFCPGSFALSVPHFSGEVVCRTIFLSSFLCFLSDQAVRDHSCQKSAENQGRGLMQLLAATSPTESKTVSRISVVVPPAILSEELMRILCYLFLKICALPDLHLKSHLSSHVTQFPPLSLCSKTVLSDDDFEDFND